MLTSSARAANELRTTSLCSLTHYTFGTSRNCSAPDNKSPKQQLDEGEFCVVRRVPIGQLRELIDAESVSKMAIEGLFLFALGYEMGAGGKCGRCK